MGSGKIHRINPVRDKIVLKAVDYPYSSAKAHIQGLQDEILLGEALFESRQMEDYVEFNEGGYQRGRDKQHQESYKEWSSDRQ